MSPDDRAQAAVRAAGARARAAWRRYLLVLAAVVVVLAAGLWPLWRHAEIRAVASRTTSVPATPLAPGPTPARLARAWQTSDRSAVGQPVWLDVVVTFSAHTVVGRDAGTGTVRWSYSRDDRSICTVAAQNGAAVAIYAHDGNCDEATSLDVPTGKRLWVRTLFVTGENIQVSSDQGHVLIVAPNLVELLEPTGGIDWWDEKDGDDDVSERGCRNRSAVLGERGVLLASSCPSGEVLSLRAPGASKRAWSVPLAGRTPLSADQVMTVLSRDGRSIISLAPTTGKVGSTLTLGAAVQAPAVPSAHAVAGDRIELVSVRAAVLALSDSGSLQRLWQRRAAALPLEAGDGLLVPAPSGLVRLEAIDAHTLAQVSAPGVAPDAVLSALGRGVLASTSAGTAAFP